MILRNASFSSGAVACYTNAISNPKSTVTGGSIWLSFVRVLLAWSTLFRRQFAYGTTFSRHGLSTSNQRGLFYAFQVRLCRFKIFGWLHGHFSSYHGLRALQALWGHHWRGSRIVVYCDNLSVVMSMNSGRVFDKLLATCLQEIWFLAAVNEFEMRVAIFLHQRTVGPTYSVVGIWIRHISRSFFLLIVILVCNPFQSQQTCFSYGIISNSFFLCLRRYVTIQVTKGFKEDLPSSLRWGQSQESQNSVESVSLFLFLLRFYSSSSVLRGSLLVLSVPYSFHDYSVGAQLSQWCQVPSCFYGFRLPFLRGTWTQVNSPWTGMFG